MPEPAIAYLSWMRWVADCPNPACTNALELQRGQATFTCRTRTGAGACGTAADIVWPTDPDPDAVELAMAGRAPAHQSWKPGDEL